MFKKFIVNISATDVSKFIEIIEFMRLNISWKNKVSKKKKRFILLMENKFFFHIYTHKLLYIYIM